MKEKIFRYLESLDNENTRDRYARVLRYASEDLGNIEDITNNKLDAWIKEKQTWGSSSKYMAVNAIQSYIRWACGENHELLKYSFKRLPTAPQRYLTDEQALMVLSIHDTMTVKGIRDLSITSMLLDTGLRSSEICNVELDRVDMNQKSLVVWIKGGRWGTAVFSDITAQYTQNWIAVRKDIAKCKELYCGIGGSTPGKKMTRDGLRCVVSKWGKACGIKLSPHDFRRTFAVMATKSGSPARVLQEAGRWKSMEMVELYTRYITVDEFRKYLPVDRIMS
jgi:integrase/recombinase XerD